jgi:hypothetical protein
MWRMLYHDEGVQDSRFAQVMGFIPILRNITQHVSLTQVRAPPPSHTSTQSLVCFRRQLQSEAG